MRVYNLIVGFISTFCITFLLSCSGSSRSANLPDMDSTTVKIQIDINDNNAAELRYSDVYTDVAYVKLESQKESSIGIINKLEISKHNDIIVFDRANGKILRFTPTGKYLNNIGRMGHAKNEYVCPELMAYDEYNNNVIVYDGAKKILMHYSLDGALVNETALHKYIADFGVVNESTLAIFANHRDILEDGQTAYNMELIGHDGNVINQYEPYTNERGNFRPAPNNTFINIDGQLLYHQYYTPVFYTVTEKDIKQAIYVDFMSKQIPADWLSCTKDQDVDAKIFRGDCDVAYCNVFYHSKNYYILNATLSKGYIVTIFVNKKDSSKQAMGAFMFNDIKGLLTSSVSLYKKGKVYGIIYSESVDNFNATLNTPLRLDNYKRILQEKKKYTITDNDTCLIHQLSNNINPIIQICTLK